MMYVIISDYTQGLKAIISNATFMLTQKRMVIGALLAFDILISTKIVLNDAGFQTITQVLLLNAILGGPASLGYFLFSKRPFPKKFGFQHLFNGLGRGKKSKPVSARKRLITTKHGEHVRNIGESRIADYLYSNQIAYSYEVIKLGPRKRLTRSAFYLQDFRAYLLYRANPSTPSSDTSSGPQELDEWRIAKQDVPDVQFFFIDPRNLKTLDSSLGTILNKLKSLEIPN